MVICLGPFEPSHSWDRTLRRRPSYMLWYTKYRGPKWLVLATSGSGLRVFLARYVHMCVIVPVDGFVHAEKKVSLVRSSSLAPSAI